mmetsp:Transcript_42648/g.51205  ORF Transcript_42648/g.51205 Transcript_42648/m.51205 type:complete len:309 (-) Transcript_42648:556-1482(-)
MSDEKPPPNGSLVTDRNPLGIVWASGFDGKGGGEKLKKSSLSCLPARNAQAKYGISWSEFCNHKVPGYRFGGGYGDKDLYFYVAHADCELLRVHLERKEHGDKYESVKRKRAVDDAVASEIYEAEEWFKRSMEKVGPYLESGLSGSIPDATGIEEKMFCKIDAKTNFKMNDGDMKEVVGITVGKKTMYKGSDLYKFATKHNFKRKMRNLDSEKECSAFAATNPVFREFVVAPLMKDLDEAAKKCSAGTKRSVLGERCAAARAEVERAERNLKLAEALQERLMDGGVEEAEIRREAEAAYDRQARQKKC